MKRSRIIGCVAAISVLDATANAQPPPPVTPPPVAPASPVVTAISHVLTQARFDALRDNTVTIRKGTFRDVAADTFDEKRKDAQDRDPFPSAAMQAPALNPPSSVTAIERATAAIRTSIDGADAGVSVAPFALAGFDQWPVQLNLTLAALKDGKTEYGLGISLQTAWNPLSPKDIGLAPCDFEQKKEGLIAAIDDLRFPLEETCDLLGGLNKNVDQIRDNAAFKEALKICSTTTTCPAANQQGPAECLGLSEFIADEKKALKALRASYSDPKATIVRGSPEWLQIERQIFSAQPSLDALAAFQEKKYPAPDCFTQQGLGDAMVNANWNEARWRLGIGGTFDVFPVSWGFNPESSSNLPHGELSKVVGKVEGARTSGAYEIHVGGGVGGSRTDIDKPLNIYVSPSVSLTGTVTSLSSVPLVEHGKLNLVNGNLPPRLALGIDGQAEIGLKRPNTQVTALQSLTVTGYADFLFTEKLGFRLGVPVTGKLVTRKGDASKSPPILELTNIQWSIPVFATTVLKL